VSWHTARLSDVCHFENGDRGKNYPGKSALLDAGIPFVNAGDLQEGVVRLDGLSFIAPSHYEKLSNGKFSQGDFLFCLRGSLGKFAYLDRAIKGAIASSLIIIRPQDGLHADYLKHYLASEICKKEIALHANGAAQPNLAASSLKQFKIPLPPLDVQKRIAAILDKADQLRQKRRQAISLLDSLTQSIFLEMFGDPDQNLLRLDYVPLIELVDPKDRLNYGVVQPGEDIENGVPLIRVSDLGEGVVDRSKLRLINPQISRKHSKSVLKGTEILISCVGSIGEIALVSEADKGSNIARAVARVPLREGISRDFVAAYLRTEKVKRYFTKELRTSSQPTLNIKEISETLVPKISRAQAVEFENRVRYTQRLNDLGKIHDGKVSSLFASLQHRAFTGQL